MKVKDYKELINSLPDEYDIGCMERYDEGNNLCFHTARRFIDIGNIEIDAKSKRIILYTK